MSTFKIAFSPGRKTFARRKWRSLQALIKASGFWELHSKDGRIGIHGYSALLEGQRDGKYHGASRWCPRHKNDNEWFEFPY